MSQHYKPGRIASQPTLFQTPPSEVHPNERERIAQLIVLEQVLEGSGSCQRCSSALPQHRLRRAVGGCLWRALRVARGTRN